MFIDILGFKIYKNRKSELLDFIEKYPKVHIISGNPEVLFNALNSEILKCNFSGSNSLIIPDGIGTVIASKIIRNPVKEKIAGIELMMDIIKKCSEEGKGIYLLGAKEEVLNSCCDRLKENYPELKVAGKHNGYFEVENSGEILTDIKESGAYALFVAMGCPRQEEFISLHMNELPCKIFMGVGGSFDVIAGNVNRAPKWMIKLGLEWLYRVMKEPWRIKRLGSIPKFLVMVIKSKSEVNK
ncbi:MAG: WecB/TagA/CpsF family glycosyltransferase [Clostridiaceae bacterium]